MINTCQFVQLHHDIKLEKKIELQSLKILRKSEIIILIMHISLLIDSTSLYPYVYFLTTIVILINSTSLLCYNIINPQTLAISDNCR